MGETPDQIERHIHEKRNELGDNIHELQEKVKTAVDWRAQFQERPMTLVGLAFGGGVLLALLFGGRRETHRRSRNWSRQRDREQSSSLDRRSSKQRNLDDPASSAWDNIRGAVLAVASAKLGGVIEQVLPGFQDQYNKRQREGRPSTSRPNGPESIWNKTASETGHNPKG